jgi:nucleoside-diphosphate kinase
MCLCSASRVAAGAIATAGVVAAVWGVIDPVSCEPAKKLPPHGAAGTQYERSFIAIKPDGVQRGLVGEIIARFEKRGYKLVAMKLIHPTKAMAEKHYGTL